MTDSSQPPQFTREDVRLLDELYNEADARHDVSREFGDFERMERIKSLIRRMTALLPAESA